jgi:DNA polymerase III gamma/tau subunit
MISILLKVNQEEDQTELAEEYLLEQGLINKKKSPNLVWINPEQSSLKIKTVRNLIKQASYQTYSNQTQVYAILKADTASTPAQNALLKIIEEPPSNTQLVLVANRANRLLGTIKSRCKIETYQATTESDSKNPVPELSKLSQLNYSQLSYSQIINLANQYKNRQDALMMVKKLINLCYNKEADFPNRTQILKCLAQAYQHLGMNANVRLTLEHCFFQIKA